MLFLLPVGGQPWGKEHWRKREREREGERDTITDRPYDREKESEREGKRRGGSGADGETKCKIIRICFGALAGGQRSERERSGSKNIERERVSD